MTSYRCQAPCRHPACLYAQAGASMLCGVGASSYFEKHILRMVWVVRQLLSLDLKEAKALLDILVGEVEKRGS